MLSPPPSAITINHRLYLLIYSDDRGIHYFSSNDRKNRSAVRASGRKLQI